MDGRHLILYVSEKIEDLDKLVKEADLRDLPYEFIPIRSLTELKDLLRKMECDLVISDAEVGENSLFEECDIFFGSPVIVLSDQASQDTAILALRTGAKDYIPRQDNPDFFRELITAAEKSIRNFHNERKLREYHKELEKIISSQYSSIEHSKKVLSSEIMQKTKAISDLNEAREIYRKFFQTSQDAAFISSKDGRWIDMNNVALDLFGYKNREEIWSDSVLDFYINPAERQAFTEIVQEKGLVKDYPSRLRKKDGTSFDVLISASPYVVQREFIGYQGFIKNISDQVEAEEVNNHLMINQQVLDSLSRALGGSLDLAEIGDQIADHLKQLVSFDMLNMMRYDQKTGIYTSVYLSCDKSFEALTPIRSALTKKPDLEVKEPLAGIQSPYLVPDLYGFLMNDTTYGLEDAERFTASALMVPIIGENDLIGLFQLISMEDGIFQEEDLDLLGLASSVVAIGTQKTFLLEESRSMVKKLTSLQRIETTILENLSLSTTLDLTLDMLVQELEVDAADVLYFHPDDCCLKQYSRTGFRQKALNFSHLEVGLGLGGIVAETQKMQFIPDLSLKGEIIQRKLEFETENFCSYLGLPLMNKGKLVGVLEIFNRTTLEPDNDWVNLLEIVAGLLAISIDFQNLHQTLKRSRAEISVAFDKLIKGWASALELRGIEPRGHSERIENLTLELAERLGLPAAEQENLRRGVLLHDIGKMGISDDVLLKKANLSKEDRKKIGQHPLDAYDLLKPIKILDQALDIPLYHHERWDGDGYPTGKSGEEIPLHARIFAVVDVWDALLTSRPYREAYSKAEAIKHIREQSGKHFDPRVAKAFLEMVDFRETEDETEQPTEELANLIVGNL